MEQQQSNMHNVIGAKNTGKKKSNNEVQHLEGNTVREGMEP